MAQVVVDGEMLVVDPDRAPVEWNPVETLPVSRYVPQFRLDVGADSGDVDATVLAFEWGGVEQCRIKGDPGKAAIRAHLQFLLTVECPPDPAEGPRHTLAATFGQPAGTGEPRALLT